MNRIALRRWQRRALERLDAAETPDFLTVATPGAGKTTFALVAVRRTMVAHPGRKVVIVAPTAHLKSQWAAAAARFELVFEDQWRPGDGALPGDVHGIVTTYQQVSASPEAISRIAAGGLVVLDEIHHAGDDHAWGDGVREAFRGANWRLALSGTPFRSDSHAIPFVRYALDEAIPDFEYGYGDALADGGVIRQVEFPELDGDMEWIDAEGAQRSASFDETLSRTLASQRLRTALSPDGEWLPAVLGAANDRLVEIRRSHPNAGGLVIATDQDHARAIAELLRTRHHTPAVVATSDDDRASSHIARFTGSDEPWLVAVRMVSEGVDIPRLAVGVFATTTATELFFRQAVGRLVRARPDDGDLVASMFIPADRRLRAHAHDITRVRRHHLATTAHRRVETSDADTDEPTEQMSLFAAVSATPVGAPGSDRTKRPVPALGTVSVGPLSVGAVAQVDDSLVMDLPPLPRPATSTGRAPVHANGDASGHGVVAHAETPARRRRHLRTLNAARAADLVRVANLSHSAVNRELNRLAGITRITEATEAQLERRLAAAEAWLRR